MPSEADVPSFSSRPPAKPAKPVRLTDAPAAVSTVHLPLTTPCQSLDVAYEPSPVSVTADEPKCGV